MIIFGFAHKNPIESSIVSYGHSLPQIPISNQIKNYGHFFKKTIPTYSQFPGPYFYSHNFYELSLILHYFNHFYTIIGKRLYSNNAVFIKFISYVNLNT